jgi:pimeloyl-ACP methyl ester carboxylesterase
VTEKVFTFGPSSGLVGVIAEPDAGRRLPDAPAVLLWNVGINHRVGPFRLFVDMARHLVAAGFTVLRFDVSGLGDSEVRKDAFNEFERATLDVREAMDALAKRRGIQRFVLVGFCSSVDAAHVLALSDPRVAGVAFVEGYVWRTRGYFLRYPLRFLSRARWERFLALRFPGLVRAPAGQPRESREEVYLRDYPTLEKFRRDVREMVAQGKKLLFVYVSGDSGFDYPEQFFDMLGSRELEGKLDVEFHKDADHTFYLTGDRARLIERVCRWASDSFGRASSAVETAPAALTGPGR